MREPLEMSKRENASPSEENMNVKNFQPKSGACVHQTWSSLVNKSLVWNLFASNLVITGLQKDYSKPLKFGHH